MGARSGARARDEASGPRERGGGMSEPASGRSEWPLWEIFIRSAHGLAHKHVGSLHAADGTMALENARDVYTRRSEGPERVGRALDGHFRESSERAR